MKMQDAHFAFLKEAVTPYIIGPTVPLYKALGLSPKRYRWDCQYAAKISTWVCNTLYPYLDDSHIDTALRQIMRDAGVTWAAQP